MAKKKQKDFVRAGRVVALRQGGASGGHWWTVFPNDENPKGAFELYTGIVGPDETLDNLITVLNKIKKQGE